MADPAGQELNSLNEQQWIELYNRLLLFTVKRYGWLKESGLDVNDVVQQAIIDTLQGKVRLTVNDSPSAEANRHLDFFPLLCNVIRKNVSDLRKRERLNSQAEIYELDLDVERITEESEISAKDLEKWRAALVTKQTPETLALDRELRDRIHNAVADDPELIQVITLLFYSPASRPKEIAEQLGIPIRQTYHILKRLRRRLMLMQEKTINE